MKVARCTQQALVAFGRVLAVHVRTALVHTRDMLKHLCLLIVSNHDANQRPPRFTCAYVRGDLLETMTHCLGGTWPRMINARGGHATLGHRSSPPSTDVTLGEEFRRVESLAVHHGRL